MCACVCVCVYVCACVGFRQVCGYECVEFNCSASRKKSEFERTILGLSQNRTLTGMQQQQQQQQQLGKSKGKSKDKNKKGRGGDGSGGQNTLIIMDEVDGMGRQDLGGVSMLTKMIKASRNPVIAILNDKDKQSMRTLKEMCYDVGWRRPQKQSITKRLTEIAQSEGLQVGVAMYDLITLYLLLPA